MQGAAEACETVAVVFHVMFQQPRDEALHNCQLLQEGQPSIRGLCKAPAAHCLELHDVRSKPEPNAHRRRGQ